MNDMTISKRFVLDVDVETRSTLRQLIGDERVVLASGSPRRREILRLAGINCDVAIPEVDETVTDGVEPRKFAIDLAKVKLESIDKQNDLTIAADTIVVLGDVILGKPVDKADAFRMLKTLSGERHYVITALAIRDRIGRVAADADRTYVRFRRLTDAGINSYIDSGEPMDKAGAYGIQGMGELLVESLEGSLHNVIGFPIEMFVRMMRELRA
ncbi:MAG: Maf family protein [Candidatus Zixiibacteriota bacterium]